jgi:hypothetical protein
MVTVGPAIGLITPTFMSEVAIDPFAVAREVTLATGLPAVICSVS